MATNRAPYGTWESPITAAAIIQGSVSLREVIVDKITSEIYHLEARPSENREVLVATNTGRDIIPASSTTASWNVRNGVHEYGGAAAVVHAGVAYFSNLSDGRVYTVNANEEGGIPEAVTPESTVHRFANFTVHPKHHNLLVCVLEDHAEDRPSTVLNSLVLIDSTSCTVTPLVSGADFYADPKFSPDGTHLAWQQWSHPAMPWEAAEIHVADVIVGADHSTLKLDTSSPIAGDKKKVSVGYPSWISNETLSFTSDASGYQNPWIYNIKTRKASAVLRQPLPYDFAGPAWQLGGSPYAVVNNGQSAIFALTQNGRNTLCQVHFESGEAAAIECPYVNIPCIRAVSDSQVVFVAQTATESTTIVELELLATKFTVVKPSSSSIMFPIEIISSPRPISLEVPGRDGQSAPLHVVYYAPTNPEYGNVSSIAGEKPPCIVNAHGGPTSLTGQGLLWSKQYFTSRGFAWVDVNYGGSSGYGRAYTDRLIGKWGVVDVEDCILAARTLSGSPYSLIDAKRIVIRGGSAGGYTVLSALSTASDVSVFAAGTSNYGISDLKKLGEDTHKFESKYLEKLIGGTYEGVKEIYEARSPVVHANKIVAPLLILQGANDRVVPKEQAESIYQSINARGGIVEYKLYEGEGHGWRLEATLKDALERELTFYKKVLQLL